MTRPGQATVTVALCLSLLALRTGARTEDGYTHVEIADCHVHLLDFLQNGDFLVNGRFMRGTTGVRPKRGERGQRIEALLKMMDHAHVSPAMVSGMPFLKKWSANDPVRSRYYLNSSSRVKRARDTDIEIAEAVLNFSKHPDREAQLARIHPFLCGFDGTDLGAVDLIVKRVKDYPGIWKGIGEVMSRHDDLSNLTTGERPSAKHPALYRVYDFAGSHGLPVSIHHNIAAVSANGEFRKPVYLKELVKAFEDHRATKFIWCHAGVSRRVHVKDLPGLLRSVLTEHKEHVYLDLSWVVLQNYILKDLESWTALISEYPENFMVGSDVVGNLRNYVSTIRAYDRLFDVLKDEKTVERVASRNFVELMPKTGLTLDPGYKYPEDNFVPR